MFTTVTGLLAVVLYLATAVLLVRRLVRATGERLALLALGLAAVALHGAVLGQDLLGNGAIDLSFFTTLSLVTWLMAALILLGALRAPLENLGVGALPLAALGLGLELSPLADERAMPAMDSAMQAHIVLSLLAFSLLAIAAFQAALLAIQDHYLRLRRPGGFVRALPPLETMERLLFRIIALGFIFLTAALLLGWVALEDLFAQHLVHKTALSLVAWAVFGILLWGRWYFGWRGRTAVRWTTGGLTVLLLAYFGSKLVLELILGLD